MFTIKCHCPHPSESCGLTHLTVSTDAGDLAHGAGDVLCTGLAPSPCGASPCAQLKAFGKFAFRATIAGSTHFWVVKLIFFL